MARHEYVASQRSILNYKVQREFMFVEIFEVFFLFFFPSFLCIIMNIDDTCCCADTNTLVGRTEMVCGW